MGYRGEWLWSYYYDVGENEDVGEQISAGFFFDNYISWGIYIADQRDLVKNGYIVLHELVHLGIHAWFYPFGLHIRVHGWWDWLSERFIDLIFPE